jgi:uncharacterized protein (DUF2147 family)
MPTLIKVLILSIFSFMTVSYANPIDETAILGIWINQAGDGLIEISQQQGRYTGTIIGSTDGKDRHDDHNPDPALRNRSLQDVIVLGDFGYLGDKKWGNGWVYDPNNGKTYRCKMTLINHNTLDIRGYIGFSIFGRTETWTKQEK